MGSSRFVVACVVGGVVLGGGVAVCWLAELKTREGTLSNAAGNKLSWSTLYADAREPASRQRVSLVLSADPGDLIGGFGEARVLFDESSESRPDPLASELFCVAAHRVRLSGFEVLLATTGIGATRAALCLDSLLRAYGDRVREIIFLGTAGGSPALGGLLDSDDCSTHAEAAPSKIVRLGDVCVSPFATNWDCQRCFWASEPYDVAGISEKKVKERQACARVPCSLHERWDLFGDFGCSFYNEPSLADQILEAAAAHATLLPETPEGVASLERQYWTSSTGLDEAWPQAYETRRAMYGNKPKVWPYRLCSEATSTTYWNGAPFDELARSYVAELIDQAHEGLGLPHGGRTKRDVVAFSAMEATGWMTILKLSEVYLNFTHIPSANVRAVSDYTHDPLVRGELDRWFEDANWLSTDELRRNSTRLGYSFAIQSTSAVVLALFAHRAAAPPLDRR